MNAINPYLKFAVAILGAVVTSLTTIYSGAHWLPVVTSVATAISVYLTPNIFPMSAAKQVKTSAAPFTGE